MFEENSQLPTTNMQRAEQRIQQRGSPHDIFQIEVNMQRDLIQNLLSGDWTFKNNLSQIQNRLKNNTNKMGEFESYIEKNLQKQDLINLLASFEIINMECQNDQMQQNIHQRRRRQKIVYTKLIVKKQFQKRLSTSHLQEISSNLRSKDKKCLFFTFIAYVYMLLTLLLLPFTVLLVIKDIAQFSVKYDQARVAVFFIFGQLGFISFVYSFFLGMQKTFKTLCQSECCKDCCHKEKSLGKQRQSNQRKLTIKSSDIIQLKKKYFSSAI